MNDSYNVRLTFWPAQRIPASVAQELNEIGVDLARLSVSDGFLVAKRAPINHALILEIALAQGDLGWIDLEPVLAHLRLARMSYLAWETEPGQLIGSARAFDSLDGIERRITVTADGEPVMTARDLEGLDRPHGTYQALLEKVQTCLRPAVPSGLEAISVQDVRIIVVPDEEPDEPEQVDVRQGGDGT